MQSFRVRRVPRAELGHALYQDVVELECRVCVPEAGGETDKGAFVLCHEPSVGTSIRCPDCGRFSNVPKKSRWQAGRPVKEETVDAEPVAPPPRGYTLTVWENDAQLESRKINDPFIHTTIQPRGWRMAWRLLRRRYRVLVVVGGSPETVDHVMGPGDGVLWGDIDAATDGRPQAFDGEDTSAVAS